MLPDPSTDGNGAGDICPVNFDEVEIAVNKVHPITTQPCRALDDDGAIRSDVRGINPGGKGDRVGEVEAASGGNLDILIDAVEAQGIAHPAGDKGRAVE